MDSARMFRVLVFLFLACFNGGAEATAKVLMSPSSLFPDHRWIMKDLAAELVNRGHKVRCDCFVQENK